MIFNFQIFLKGSVTRYFTIFEQNEATIPLFIYKTILKHQEEKNLPSSEIEASHGLF